MNHTGEWRCAVVAAPFNLQVGVNVLDFASFDFAPEIDLTNATRVVLALQSHIGGAGTARGTIPPTAEGSGIFVSEFRTGGQLPASTSTSTSTSTSSSSVASSTTIVPPTTTTTTLPANPCAAVPVAATFASIACRLDALLARVQAEPALGTLQAKLGKALGKAATRHAEAADFCAASDLKRSQKRLKKVGRALTQFARRLESKAARKRLDQTLRESLRVDGESILADVTTLRSTLACPGAG